MYLPNQPEKQDFSIIFKNWINQGADVGMIRLRISNFHHSIADRCYKRNELMIRLSNEKRLPVVRAFEVRNFNSRFDQ